MRFKCTNLNHLNSKFLNLPLLACGLNGSNSSGNGQLTSLHGTQDDLPSSKHSSDGQTNLKMRDITKKALNKKNYTVYTIFLSYRWSSTRISEPQLRLR